MTGEPVRDRKRGMLLGLAIGDALGAAVEFKRPGSFEPVSHYRSGGPHGLAPGEWTDDTSMALALASSIVEKGWDLADQAQRYVDWWRLGKYSITGRCFDIGITTKEALLNFEKTGNAHSSGPADTHSSGNGSIMRLAPVPIAYAHCFEDRLDQLIEYAIQSSLPTHRSDMCQSACAGLAVILGGLVNGIARETVLDPDWQIWQSVTKIHQLEPRVAEVISGSFRNKKPPEIRGSGFVVESLEAALWAFSTSSDFGEAVLKAVNLGDDADTTGAICGQLAGAFWGESGIPDSLLTGLAGRDMLDPVLDRIIG